MYELKACPFCNIAPELVSLVTPVRYFYHCPNCGIGAETQGFDRNEARNLWNTRPLEDALQARITELEAENAILTAELAELNNKAVFIQFENEDELPADISSDIYSAMFNCSHVDVVRLFPYIKENGQKYYLVMLREDE